MIPPPSDAPTGSARQPGYADSNRSGLILGVAAVGLAASLLGIGIYSALHRTTESCINVSGIAECRSAKGPGGLLPDQDPNYGYNDRSQVAKR